MNIDKIEYRKRHLRRDKMASCKKIIGQDLRDYDAIKEQEFVDYLRLLDSLMDDLDTMRSTVNKYRNSRDNLVDIKNDYLSVCKRAGYRVNRYLKKIDRDKNEIIFEQMLHVRDGFVHYYHRFRINSECDIAFTRELQHFKFLISNYKLCAGEEFKL